MTNLEDYAANRHTGGMSQRARERYYWEPYKRGFLLFDREQYQAMGKVHDQDTADLIVAALNNWEG